MSGVENEKSRQRGLGSVVSFSVLPGEERRPKTNRRIFSITTAHFRWTGNKRQKLGLLCFLKI